MADTIYTQIFTYQPSGSACQPGNAAALVPITSFAITGDTDHPITNITSVTITTKIRRYNKGHSGTEGWIGGINFADGTNVRSDRVSASAVSSSTARAVSATFAINGSLKLEEISEIYSRADGIDSSDANVATQFGKYPLVVTISYTSAQYYPAILSLTARRCDQDGTVNPRGSYCKINYKYTIGETASESVSASLTVTDGTRTHVIYNTKANVESNKDRDAWIVFSPLGGGEIAGGAAYTFVMTLTYGQETAAAQQSVGKTFAPLAFHNKCVSIGQFPDIPKDWDGDGRFASNWKGYFYHGIEVHDFHEGDTLTLTGGTFFGYVTDSTRKIVFAIPVGKSLHGINSATLTALTANIANNGGYGITESSVTGGSSYMGSGITRTVRVFAERNVIEITLERSSAWNLTNNDCVNVRCETIALTMHTA